MKIKKEILSIIILLLSIGISCKPDNVLPNIVSFDNKESFEKILLLKLDDSYKNLLDPKNTSEEEYDNILSSWTEFHNRITQYMDEENFNWNISESEIKMTAKIYFDKSGNIEYYLYKIKNENVTKEKRKEFGKLLNKFSQNENIGLIRNEQFSQCGRVKYLNQ